MGLPQYGPFVWDSCKCCRVNCRERKLRQFPAARVQGWPVLRQAGSVSGNTLDIHTFNYKPIS
jgi:hypothetical protein